MSCTYFPSIVQGETWTRVIDWKDSDGDLVDLTGYSARLQFRRGSALVLELASGDGITLGGTAGTITLTIDAEATADLEAGTLDFDLFLTSGSGVVTRILVGEVAVLAAITV